jgi:hypothetical protein
LSTLKTLKHKSKSFLFYKRNVQNLYNKMNVFFWNKQHLDWARFSGLVIRLKESL